MAAAVSTPYASRKIERLGDQLDGAGHDQLVGRLDGLTGAGRSDVHDGLADGLQHRAYGLDDVGVAADHDRQRGLDGPGLAAGDRGVDGLDALLGGLLGQLHRHVGSDRGAVDPDGAGLGVGEDAVLAAATASTSGESGTIVMITSASATASAMLSAPVPPASTRAVDLAAAAVVAGHGVAGLDQVGGHRAAHDAEADEGDAGLGVGHDQVLRQCQVSVSGVPVGDQERSRGVIRSAPRGGASRTDRPRSPCTPGRRTRRSRRRLAAASHSASGSSPVPG